ncbi:MAG: hypothetical protein IKG82_13545 [Oscillospiraceae bacterium]|nr:hypothetical protein [Oscillospiraceae bacterium]
MNAERFMELMNTLPDDMIVTAVHAEYRRRPKLMRFLPAIAACLVIGIFAAVYPKLRIQTPEITEPPAAIVTTETTAQNTAETTAVTVYTTAVRQDATHRTTAETVSQTVTETVTNAVTEQDSAPVQTAPVLQNETKPVTATKQAAVSAEVTETTALPKQTIPITVRKYTRSLPERPNGGGDVHNPPPGTPESPDEPDSPNEAVMTPVSEEPKAKIVDYFDYYSVSFYDITADAALLSGQYDGRILSLQFLRLEYDPADGIPLIEETVELQLDLPENLKGHIEEVRADVSVTTDAAAFADASKQEPEIIYIPRKEDDL